MDRMTPRYAWDDLWAFASGRGLTMTRLAELVGIDARQVHRWKRYGYLPEATADRVAVALGVLPGDVWAQWDADGLAAADAYDARQRALKAARLRRWRARHPEARERAKEYRRAYYAENRDYELRRQRAYDARKRAAS